MGDTKIRIDLANGVVEAEGSEKFVQAIYEDFKDRVQAGDHAEPDDTDTGAGKKAAKKVKKANSGKKASKKKSATSGSGKATVKMLNDLDLSGDKDKPKLRDYYAKFKPTKNYQRNLIFVYYLTEVLGMTGVTMDHIYTCYRTVPGVKAPKSAKALEQSLRDTTRDKAWLNIDDINNIKAGNPGLDYMEIDMPKSDAES